MIIKAFQKKQEDEIAKIDTKPTQDASEIAMRAGIPFSDAEALSVADTLYQYMEDCGTDEQGILMELSQGYNGKALQKIYKAYGLKRSGYVLGCHGNVAVGGTKKDLGGWFRAELQGEPELEAIRTIFRKANIII
jgi:hypothetical protein